MEKNWKNSGIKGVIVRLLFSIGIGFDLILFFQV